MAVAESTGSWAYQLPGISALAEDEVDDGGDDDDKIGIRRRGQWRNRTVPGATGRIRRDALS